MRTFFAMLLFCLLAGLLPRSASSTEWRIPGRWFDIGIVAKSVRVPDKYSFLWIFTVSIVVVTYFNKSTQFYSIQEGL